MCPSARARSLPRAGPRPPSCRTRWLAVPCTWCHEAVAAVMATVRVDGWVWCGVVWCKRRGVGMVWGAMEVHFSQPRTHVLCSTATVLGWVRARLLARAV